jgi:glyoxylase I family protein
MRNVAEALPQVKRVPRGARRKKTRAPARESAYNISMDYTLEHLGLSAQAPATLKDWYVNMLGAQVVFDNRQSPPMFLLALPGGRLLEIYAGDFGLKETANNKLNGWRHVALRVTSIEGARAELERRGVRFTEDIKPAGGGGRVLFFQDPEGNLLHLVERPAGWGGEGME